jgi:flagellar hook-length control protein FliK
VEAATQEAGKERAPAGVTQRAENFPTAPDPSPDKTTSAQPVAAKGSARNIIQSVAPQKQASARDNGPAQNLTVRYTQAGETASATQSRPVSTPANRLPEFISQLADRLELQIQRGENQIRIQLKPESLGQLQITAVNGIEGIVGRIVTESGRMREYLENNLPILQQSLQDQGLKVDRIEVVLQDSLDARQPNTQQQPLNHSGRGHGEDSPEHSSGATRVQSRTSSDGFAVDPLSRLTLGPDSTFHTIA